MSVGVQMARDGAAYPLSVRGHLKQVRAAAEDILAFVAEFDEAGLLALPEADRCTFRALKDALCEIGDRVKCLPPDLLVRHPGVDWQGWAALPGVVSNRNFGPELRRLHPVVAEDLPALLAAVETELALLEAGKVDC